MRVLRHIGSVAFVLGLFTVVFAGIPWHVLVADDPDVPLWLEIAVFCLLGGVLVVLATVAIEQRMARPPAGEPPAAEGGGDVVLLNSDALPGRRIEQVLGLGSV